jgi:hypothetical protein
LEKLITRSKIVTGPHLRAESEEAPPLVVYGGRSVIWHFATHQIDRDVYYIKHPVLERKGCRLIGDTRVLDEASPSVHVLTEVER